MANKHNLNVGQELWYVPCNRWSMPHTVKVAEIGRKWAKLEGAPEGARQSRVSLETLDMDGGEYASPGRCYLSLEDYEGERIKVEAWHKFITCIRNVPPPCGVTVEDIMQARKILKLD